MAQVTSGIRKILDFPIVYDTLQLFFGTTSIRKWLADDYILDKDGNNRILDVGCGTASILSYLNASGVDYVGFDPSERYISMARRRHGKKGVFRCDYVSKEIIDDEEPFDTIIAMGVLHHLDDCEVRNLVEVLKKGLKPGGRFIALDGCYVEGQNKLAKYLIDKDRGQNVRTEAGYRDLFLGDFDKVSTEIKHKRWIPYTYCILVVQN
jgi:SAM-dependent methyltransferase